MRKEIIFKAKRKDNGEWVYGAYFNMHHSDGRKHTHHFIIPDGTDMHFGTPLEKIQVEIDPDTLRVYTYAENTEPEEMLMALRKGVQEQYEAYQEIVRWSNDGPKGHKDRIRGKEVMSVLEELFGDKCLPDPTVLNAPSGGGGMSLKPPAYKLDVETDTPNTPNSGELKSDKDISILETSTTVEPKFEVGDKVRVLENAILADNRGKIATIVKQGQCCKGYGWVLDISKSVFLESELEPYTEPESRNLSQEIANCDKSKDNQLKDNMEKELNLCELLKVGDTVYSPTFGERTVNSIMSDRLCDSTFICYKNGKIWDKGECIVYPSRALYEKYPLDPVKAWSIWASERKPKHVLQAEIRLISNDGKTIEDYENVEVEVSDVDLTQAAEAVRECLEKFHSEHTKQ